MSTGTSPTWTPQIPSRRFMRPVIAALVTAVFFLAACSSSSSTSPGATSAAGGSDSPARSSSSSDAATALVAKGYAGTDRALPASAPKPSAGKRVWVLSCAEFSPGCAVPSASAVDAGTAIGWKMSLKDGKLDPSLYNSIIRSATAARVDAIILVSIGCQGVAGAVQAAKAAGVEVFGMLSVDCSPGLFSANVSFGGTSYSDYLAAGTQLLAAWTAVQTKGKGKVIVPELTVDPTLTLLANSYADALTTLCSGCQVYKVTVPLQVAQTGQFAPFLTTTLSKYPQATVIDSLVDGLIGSGGSQVISAAKAQGRKILLLGNEGFADNIKLIKSGIQAVASGSPAGWFGYASIDGLSRLFAGQPQIDEGIGHQLIDASHIPTSAASTSGYSGNPKSQGFIAHYRKIWGL